MKLNKQKDYNVGFVVDGSFLPIRNGTYYSIYHLMSYLSDTSFVKPNLIIGYRGWDDPRLYYRKKFRTIFLPINDYYNNTGVLNYIFNFYNIKFVHIYNAEEVLNLGQRLKNINVKVIYEAVNIDHILYGRLMGDTKKVRKLKSLQQKALKVADYVLCRSEIDKRHILNMGIDSKKIGIYRGSINVNDIKFKVRKKPKYKLVFLGHMYYPPNENALKLIADKILPELKKINKKYSVTILGLTPCNIINKYKKKEIIFKNGINNLSEELLKYDLAITPLTEGSGTRLKILDYLASGLPIITTDIGIEGLHGKIKDYLIIENNIYNYASRIDKIMKSLEKYGNMSIGGRRFVERYYNWKSNLKPFTNIYKKYG